MLFNTNLDNLIFNNPYNNQSNHLTILSGYLGPNPVEKLKDLPLNSTVIYGMYGDRGIQEKLHNALIDIQLNISNIDIYYSTVPIHSKCYMWENQSDKIEYALIGSANFSNNGLTTPYREILTETPSNTFEPLEKYIDIVMENSILCTDINQVKDSNRIIQTPSIQVSTQFCKVSLLDRNGNIAEKSGLNWMFSSGHVSFNDAYIAIKKDYIRQYPNLFPPKQQFPSINHNGRLQRHNDSIEIIWDDGFKMNALLEGSQDEYGVIYPKQISSAPKKSIMGEYIRYRLGLPMGTFITKTHLFNYGRTDIDISLLDDGIYYFDFSNKTRKIL